LSRPAQRPPSAPAVARQREMHSRRSGAGRLRRWNEGSGNAYKGGTRTLLRSATLRLRLLGQVLM